MFTFSFSTAFAATKSAEDYLNDAYATLSTDLNAKYAAAVNAAADDASATTVTYETSKTVSVKFSAEAKVAVYTEVKNFYEKVLATRMAEVLAGDLTAIKSYASAYSALTAVVADEDSTYYNASVAHASFFEGAYANAGLWQKYFLKAALEEAKEDAADHLSRINLSLYSDKVMNADDPFAMTHIAFATQQQAEYIADLADITVSAENMAAQNATDLLAAKLAAVAAIEAKLEADLEVGGVVYTYKFVGETYTVPGTSTTVALAEKTDLETADKADAVVRAAELAKAQSYAAAFKLAALNSNLTDAEKAKAVKEADAYLAVEAVRIAEAEEPAATEFLFEKTEYSIIGGILGGNWSTTVRYNLDKADSYAKVVAKYEALEDEAAAAKLAVGEAGTLMYVASIIDENLADAKVAIYGAATNAASLAVVVDITAGARAAASLEWAKEVALAQLAYNEKVALRTDVYGTAKYYDVEAAKVAAAYDKLEAKVAACTTVEQVKAIPTTATVSSILVKGDVVTKIKGLTKFAGELTKINTYLTAQNMLDGTTKITDDGYRAVISSDDLAKFYAKSGARTNDEIVAALEAAKEWAMTTPTVKELKDEKVALEAQIEALAKLPTLADKEAVKAAYTANANRNCAAPKNEAKLTAAINIVKGLEAAEIDKLVKALPAKITAADKAAVKAISDAITAYNAEKMYQATYSYTGFDLTAAKTAVRNSELAALEAAIAKLPVNATAAEVEAVRAMYDAYVAEYTSAYNDYAAADYINNTYRLVYAEKVVAAEKAEAEADAKAAAIADIEGLKIKANSSAKKGSITVKWTVSEEVEGVKYQVYKSTKAQKGYKKSITTSKTSFKNTKNLTKGTRYYYKVRAIGVVDGVTYYSDWSNKANRIAK